MQGIRVGICSRCKFILLTPVLFLPFRYRPSLPISYIGKILEFPDEEECLAFLVGMDAVLLDENSSVDCKLTHSKLTVPGS